MSDCIVVLSNMMEELAADWLAIYSKSSHNGTVDYDFRTDMITQDSHSDLGTECWTC